VLPSAVRVTIHCLTLDSYVDGLAVIRVRASAGFYVRSLAHDLGQTLGCGGHLETLRRVRAGAFTEDESVPLSRIEEEGVDASRWLLPTEQLLTDIPAVVLSDRDRERAAHGADVSVDDAPRPGVGGDTTRRRLLDASGRLVAVAEMRDGGLLHPVIVLV
jgi:tRNA pseudouridine55 synthase